MNKKELVLILPDDVAEMSIGATKLCELFVFEILSSPENEIVLFVNDGDREVRSNSENVKRLISMYLGSKRLHEFYRQLGGIAHRCERDGSFSLKILVDGEIIHVAVKELSGLPDLKLQITKSSA